jgi:two-component system, chemotaxis family, sensor kinase CheA
MSMIFALMIGMLILVTSLDSPEDETHGYAVGADAFGIKSSFEKGNFISLIRRFIP